LLLNAFSGRRLAAAILVNGYEAEPGRNRTVQAAGMWDFVAVAVCASIWIFLCGGIWNSAQECKE